MCKCVSVSEQEMQQLVLFSKMLRNAVSKVQCAGCFVHCVFPVVFVCVCVSRRMSCNSFFVFNETKDESPRWYRFNVNIPCIQTARVVPVFGRLRCKPVDVAYCQFNTLISYAQEAYLRVIPIQSKLLESLESVLRRLRSISERSVCTCVCVCLSQQTWDATTWFCSAKCWKMQPPKQSAVGVSCIMFCVFINTHAVQLLFSLPRHQGYSPTLILVFEQQEV